MLAKRRRTNILHACTGQARGAGKHRSSRKESLHTGQKLPNRTDRRRWEAAQSAGKRQIARLQSTRESLQAFTHTGQAAEIARLKKKKKKKKKKKR